jgi:hypothetical protein
MGSGISISENQLYEIIQNKIKKKYHYLYQDNKYIAEEYKIYRNYLLEKEYDNYIIKLNKVRKKE